MKHNDDLKQYSILIVEDDEIALTSLSNVLRRHFKNVFSAINTHAANDIILSQPIDMILTDMRMPYQDGADFIKHLRDTGSHIPVVFMSAYTDSQTLLKVIPLNASDYLIKPIEINTVLALARKILLDKSSPKLYDKNFFTLPNNIQIDLSNKTVSTAEEMIFLTKKEFQLLTLLVKNKHSILSKTEIEYALWDNEIVSESSVKTLIKKLRAKIGEEAIVTVKNIGYKINLHP
jgi:DNA-binding response OmpR family regulator